MMDDRAYDLIIFDINGTLVGRVSDKGPSSIDDWSLLPRRQEVLWALQDQGVQIALCTNQGGVGFGYTTQRAVFDKLRALMSAVGHGNQSITSFVCYDHPRATDEHYRFDSPFRKPHPGMLLCAIYKSGCHFSRTLMVGDRLEDAQAAAAAHVAFEWARDFFGDTTTEEPHDNDR